MKYSLTELIKTFSLSLSIASLYSIIVFLTCRNTELLNMFLVSAHYEQLSFVIVGLNPFASLLFLLASIFFYKMSDAAYDAKI